MGNAESIQVLDYTDLSIGLFGGLVFFLYGMDMMTDALKAVAGSRMRNILATLTKNRFVGVITGTVVTAIIQSSSVTTVIMIGFTTAGLVSMAQCIGVILGADIGTTITAQILAFKVTKAALPMVIAGFMFAFLGKKDSIRAYGSMLMGLGLIFFGMNEMSDAMRPLRSYQPFLDLMITMNNPIKGVLVGTLFTALIQSSSASIGIIIVMASQGLLALPAAIAIALGANVGTCATAILAVIGKPREAVRIAVVHTVIKIIGVALWIGFIPELGALATFISPIAEGLEGTAKAAAEVPRQIANAHTMFNVANTLVLIGFTPQLARLAEWMVPDKPYEDVKQGIEPMYLVDELLEIPSLALARVRMEVARLGDMVELMYSEIMPTVLIGDKDDLEKVAAMDENIDILHGHIIAFLGRISREEIGDHEADLVMKYMELANHYETIGDILETGLVTVGRRRLAGGVVVSEKTRGLLEKFHKQVGFALAGATATVREKDAAMAADILAMKEGMKRLTTRVARHEANRLTADAPNRLQTYTREIEVLENLSQIFRLSQRITKVMTTIFNENDTDEVLGQKQKLRLVSDKEVAIKSSDNPAKEVKPLIEADAQTEPVPET